MRLLWPAFLFLLGLIPLLIAGYLWLLRRRRKSAIRFSSLSLIRAAMPPRLGLRRHLPFALLLLALSTLVLALSRPVATIEVPLSQTTVILTIDSSRSMLQADIPPNRIMAAQQAALNFINTQQSKVQIGVVAFARFAELIHPPSKDQESLATAVRSITTGRGTSIGSGIIEALRAISEVDSSVAPIIPGTGTELAATPLPEGQYSPNIVVLLTDGVNYGGIDPLEAALLAVERGVRVYTIGFGTENGDSSFGMGPQGGSFDQADPFAGGGGGGFFRRGIDEETLKEIAAMTGGEYFYATSANELQSVFDSLPAYFITRQETTEISFIFTAIGAVLATIGVFLALLWRPLP
jgi:Ca-activated chloride channel homolog